MPSRFLGGSIALVFGKPSLSTELIIETDTVSIISLIVSTGSFIKNIPYVNVSENNRMLFGSASCPTVPSFKFLAVL